MCMVAMSSTDPNESNAGIMKGLIYSKPLEVHGPRSHYLDVYLP